MADDVDSGILPAPLRQGPQDPVLRDAWRRERRHVVRHHHPDRGGDAETLQRLLTEVDARYAAAPGAQAALSGVCAPDGWRGRLRTTAAATGQVARHLGRTLRAKTPVGWPGHRRYFDI